MKPEDEKKTGKEDLLLRDRFVEGDDCAYAEIYRLYAKNLYAFGLSCHAKPELIEDAIHDIFVEIYGRREKLAHVHNLKLYLMVAFKNRLFYLLKKEEISVEITDKYSQFYAEKNYMDTLIEREESLVERELLVKRVMSELNQHQQEVIYHRFIEGFSLDEIALLMNINYQSVKNLLHRSIKKIRMMNPGGTVSLLVFLLSTQL